MFKTPAAAAFFAAWRAISGNAPTPHYRTVFQELSPDLIPRLMIVEQAAADKYIIRFMGTSRTQTWGDDLTGKDVLQLMSPHVAAAARKNFAAMLKHSCGMHHLVDAVTSSGRAVVMEHITVPVANDPGHPQRLINFAEELPIVAYSDQRGAIQNVSERHWIDVGAGIPAKPPAK